MVKDRGMKKWTAMMLPEHIHKLQEWEEHLSQPQRPVDLMVWELEDLQQNIHTAYTSQLPISLTVFQQNQWQTYTGLINKIYVEKALLSFSTDETIHMINLSTIQRAEMDD